MLLSKKLREERKQLAILIRQTADKIAAEKRDLRAEEKPAWEKLNADYNDLSARIQVAEQAEKIEAEERAPLGDRRIGRDDLNPREKRNRDSVPSDEVRGLALQGWLRYQSGKPLRKRQENAVKACRINLHPNDKCLRLASPNTAQIREMQRQFRSVHSSRAMDHMRETRVLSGHSGPAGGSLVPPESLMRTLELNQLYYGGMLQVAETIVTQSGERMSWPTADDTSNVGEILGESASVDNSGAGGPDPTFNKNYWDAYKFSSKMILVPYELLEEDAVFDLAGTLGEMLGERLGRIKNTRYTNGTGATQPYGLVTRATLGVTAASATAIAADEIIKLEHSVDRAYRDGGSYMCHDTILLNLRLLKDSVGRYLWMSGFDGGTPDRLNNRPLTINNDMASSMVSTNKTLLFGQLNRYKIRRVRGYRLYRLEERYRDKDRTGFIVFSREDGNLLQAGTSPVKYLQH